MILYESAPLQRRLRGTNRYCLFHRKELDEDIDRQRCDPKLMYCKIIFQVQIIHHFVSLVIDLPVVVDPSNVV